MSSGVVAALLLAIGVVCVLMGVTGSYTLLARLGLPLPGVEVEKPGSSGSLHGGVPTS